MLLITGSSKPTCRLDVLPNLTDLGLWILRILVFESVTTPSDEESRRRNMCVWHKRGWQNRRKYFVLCIHEYWTLKIQNEISNVYVYGDPRSFHCIHSLRSTYTVRTHHPWPFDLWGTGQRSQSVLSDGQITVHPYTRIWKSKKVSLNCRSKNTLIGLKITTVT